MKRIRWVLGFILLLALVTFALTNTLPSLLEWQSLFLKRTFYVLFLSSIFCLWRILRGPTSADRAVAIDILGILVLGFCAILGIATGRDWYIDIGIAWALQSFISTLALAKYLEGRNFDE
ncbi:MAG: cation:proton antiporter [Candidatus Omnitrophota bacterium]